MLSTLLDIMDNPETKRKFEELYKKLVGYVNSLNDTNKSVCQLRFLYGYNEKTIADLLNLTPKVVNIYARHRSHTINLI